MFLLKRAEHNSNLQLLILRANNTYLVFILKKILVIESFYECRTFSANYIRPSSLKTQESTSKFQEYHVNALELQFGPTLLGKCPDQAYKMK